MCRPVVAVSPVTTADGSWVMEDAGIVGEHTFRHDRIIAVAVLFCKMFFWNYIAVSCLVHHSFGEYQFIPPVEICFQ